MTGLPALLAALGVVGVVFGLLSFLIVIFSGAGLSTDLGWIGVNLVLGLALLISALALNWGTLRERMASGEARRAGRYGSSAVIGTLVAIAILGMLGFLATRYHKRIDLSEAKVHTLSDQSQKVLAGLQGDVEVTVLAPKVDQEPLRELLDKYAYASPKFKLEYADPNVRPGLLEKFSIAPDELGKGLVRVAIGGDAVKLTEPTEEKVTNALVKLTRQGSKLVYFLDGHGEKAIEGEAGAARDGYARAAESLRNENYTAKPLLLASAGKVPDDADAVILAGPRRALLPEETEALQKYLERGGAVLVAIDPRVRIDLVATLSSWGAEVDDDVVIDRTLALFGRAMTPFADHYAEHEITRGLQDPSLFHEVRSVRAKPGMTEIVSTGEASWGEKDLALLDSDGKVALDEGTDIQGPVPIGVAGRPSVTTPEQPAPKEGEEAPPAPKEPRLVVFGDADFASNEFIDAYSNRNLFVNSVNWLIGDVEAISIRPNQSRASRFQLSAEQFRTIRMLSLFVLPEVIAVLGVFTWWSRRNPARQA
jgi:ABC-type uncharacterized transport system involved in gliding motility auxiliary subunit